MFYPLSAASYRSMGQMRELAPRLQSMKEKFGDDKQKMQQAMMELYKTEKINPLGGCLPILVQIPVFIALYWVLLGSVELRGCKRLCGYLIYLKPDTLFGNLWFLPLGPLTYSNGGFNVFTNQIESKANRSNASKTNVNDAY